MSSRSAEASCPPIGRPIFVATILVGSFLLFLIQPMVARMALPRLGGAPNVWNSAMIVYQVLLLAGYAYAHFLSRRPQRQQAIVHLLLLAAGAITLPITLAALPQSAAGWEVLWVPLLLFVSVGPVFFVVSAQAPLMQRWFAAHPEAGEPWALYAASNLGSFAGLIAYPLLAEPMLSLEAQSIGWSAGYGALIALVAVTVSLRWRVRDRLHGAPVDANEGAAPIGPRRIMMWLALSAVPSGLMLSTTTHLTTDIFAMPLLWVIPLGVYLLSFVLAFADNRAPSEAVSLITPITLLSVGGFAMVSRHSGGMALAFASVALLFMIAVSLHGRLYDLRPHPSRLTLFYLVMSAGGALGGAFTAIVAPVVFDWVWEHPLLVVVAAMLIPLSPMFNWHRLEGLDPGLARIAALLLVGTALFFAHLLFNASADKDFGLYRLFLMTILCAVGLLLTPWRWMYVAVLIMTMMAQGGLGTVETTLEGDRTRSYFGVYTIQEYPSHRVRQLVHGTTLHGQQSTDPAREREPTTYYGPDTGAGLALTAAPELYGQQSRVGIVGLGTGTLACFRRPGQRWTFFEIDPAVLEFSRQGAFTFLKTCAPDARVLLGDARLEMDKLPPASFDVLAIDAFSSDAIPLHLLTDEAFGVYERVLSQDGLLVVHVSNRFISLEPVIAAIAKRRGLHTAVRSDNPQDRTLLTPSSWVVLTRDPAKLKALAETRADTPWSNLPPPAQRLWTDDYASILPFIRWDQLMGTL